MADAKAIAALKDTKASHTSESTRENETARYDEFLRATCRPIDQVTSADLTTSPDAILTSLAQLATCRTATERSLISLFDEAQQYIVAEATPTTSLIPDSRPGTDDDVLWLRGTHIPRNDGVCDYTLRALDKTLLEADSDELPVVVVEDLVTDPRFSSKPYCRPDSFARFYAAVPIRSPRGINIGVLCVVNSTPGADWQEEHSNVLRALSQIVMSHLEGNRIKNVQKRSMQMSSGLQNFIRGRFLPSQVDFSQIPLQPDFTTTPDRSSVPEDQNEAPIHSNPFLEAASAIRKSFHIDGCAFFSGDSRRLSSTPAMDGERTNENLVERVPSFSPDVCRKGSISVNSTEQLWLPCQALGSSFAQGSGTASTLPSNNGLSQPFLFNLLQQYPDGCTFDLGSHQVTSLGRMLAASPEDENAFVFLSPDNDSRNQELFPKTTQPRANSESDVSEQYEEELLKAFPDARSIAFMPIWDPQKGIWTIGGFLYSRTCYEFDQDTELSILKVLGILAAAEAFRLETLAADKAKSDILGSISHELRSPLHGITLGVELLSDSGLSSAQQNITHMIETCCRTLSDTTEHLLDYSKINKLVEPTNLGDGHSNEADPESSVVSEADARNPTRTVRLNLLVEDVIESVYAGHNYQHLSLAQMFNRSKSRKYADIEAIRRMDSTQAAEELNPTGSTYGSRELQNRDVSVFLLYDPSCSWQFRTLPGAIRRIVMNLFGNALKYTSQGVIKVSITQEQPKDSDIKERMIRLIVEDTGRGIGETFLRHNIFKPFSQEDQLSTGTGLGLSFVQRITAQLAGNISVASQVGTGTKVTVSLPMRLETVPSQHASLPNNPVQRPSKCHALRVQILNAMQNQKDVISQDHLDTNALTKRLCCDYLGMKLITDSEAEQLAPDVILTNDSVYKLSDPIAPGPATPVLVVCANALIVHQLESMYNSAGQTGMHGFISQPLTPHKLERAISKLLSLWGESQAQSQLSIPIPPPILSETTPYSQPPTPEPSSIESPFGVSAPTRDYFNTRAFLLVDDNPINLKILECFMKKLKQPYQTATNGEEAVTYYKADPGRYGCILMDISMPIMDGLEATRQIRAFERYGNMAAALVLAITGLASESTRDEATRSGVDFFVTKPAKLTELKTILRTRGFIS